MKELAEYDEVKQQRLFDADAKSLPLLSWDFHLENLKSISRMHQDLVDVDKLMAKAIVDVDLSKELTESNNVIVITDKDLKIEFASAGILEMSGYLPAEVIGKSPKMFQGPLTNQDLSKKIRKHVNKAEPFEAMLTNYKKNKSVYNCHIKGYPVFDKKGTLIKYVAVETAA